MANKVVGASGDADVINAKVDLTGATNLRIVYTKPDKTTLIKDQNNGLIIGTFDLVTPENGTFLANQWLYQVWLDGELDQCGVWQLRLTATINGKDKISVKQYFKIDKF